MNQHELTTVWGETLDRTDPLPEYPRPQLVRSSFLSLNGRWQCAFTEADAPAPEHYDREILVPFSPEAPLSGVMRQLMPKEKLWYRRTFTLDEAFLRKPRTILHFGAVDERCEVFLNGAAAGKHAGGYLPFALDVSGLVRPGENEIVVAVRDESDTSFHARGKQKLKRGGIWYTAQSGIWQTVWMENVPEQYIRALRITPDFDAGTVTVSADCGPADQKIRATALMGKRPAADGTGLSGEGVVLSLGEFRAWSPEDPYLYNLIVTCGEDAVLSYFGMRKIETRAAADGYPRIFLNGEEYFCDGLLDQGYWPDGLYTAPADEAMVFDIQTAKAAGFNTLRKHIKIEPLRWYYHCDRLGMLVWQDMVNGGSSYSPWATAYLPTLGLRFRDDSYRRFGREDPRGREEYLKETEATVALLYNSPSVVLWTAFNEGWGQFDALEMQERIRDLDSTRLIDHASGWHDQGGDLRSLHIYFRKVRFRARAARPTVLSEYGGYNLALRGHTWGSSNYGYKKFRDLESFRAAFRRLREQEIGAAKRKGLCAAIYTQLSDVEDECNGILTYDRRVNKLEE